jgi:hypothetical protein
MRVRRVNSSDEFYEDCACCGREFRFGPGLYHGQNCPGWNVMLCHGCKPPFRVGHEVAPTLRLVTALRSKGISVMLNARGLLSVP